MKKRVFIKVSRERQKKKSGKNIILRPEIAERHGNAICPQSAFFIKKWKNTFLQKPPESVTTKKWESSEKRAVFKERHKYAIQKQI